MVDIFRLETYEKFALKLGCFSDFIKENTIRRLLQILVIKLMAAFVLKLKYRSDGLNK